jgi:hypothetical protein
MYKKRLEGIHLNDSWRELLDRARSKCDSAGETTDAATFSSSWSSTANDNNNDEEATALAYATLREYLQQPPTRSSYLPIRIVVSLAVVLGREAVGKVLEEDDAGTSSLAFTPEPSKMDEEAADEERKRFRRRLERLALRREEEKYGKLTKNLGLTVPEDDVTTRTMTYAASVGLNLIIAPLSFGCFMWFFSGPLLDYVWPMKLSPNGTDIRRVMIGVMSGCGMLFVEMLLFVIRTHELDRAVRSKSRQAKNQPGPFGYYTSKTAKTFKDE